MAKQTQSKIFESLEPQERLRQLINYSNMLEVDPHVPPRRYYRSGLEMVRMANVYYDEGSLENAYVLYLKFMTLFLDKIRKHPDFKTVPSNVKAVNNLKLREILPKAEKLKEDLLNRYKEDYKRYLEELKKVEKEQKEKEEKAKASVKSNSKSNVVTGTGSDFVTAKVPGSIDSVAYPDPNLPKTPTQSIQSLTPEKNERTDYVPSIPSFDRSKKPLDGVTENFEKGRLRQVVVPSKLMTLFQSMAHANTTKNIETCGILAGKLEKNQLIITHMILPKQNGTPDSCVTTNEEEIFDYQDQHNLITIGWIHTHPTQTAFLSSVDLHTHCPYQLLMPEAIAIVCSPKYNETGFFILTPHYGLQFVANCRQTGFHPHPTDPPLFMLAEHVNIQSNIPLEVLDLRTS